MKRNGEEESFVSKRIHAVQEDHSTLLFETSIQASKTPDSEADSEESEEILCTVLRNESQGVKTMDIQSAPQNVTIACERTTLAPYEQQKRENRIPTAYEVVGVTEEEDQSNTRDVATFLNERQKLAAPNPDEFSTSSDSPVDSEKTISDDDSCSLPLKTGDHVSSQPQSDLCVSSGDLSVLKERDAITVNEASVCGREEMESESSVIESEEERSESESSVMKSEEERGDIEDVMRSESDEEKRSDDEEVMRSEKEEEEKSDGVSEEEKKSESEEKRIESNGVSEEEKSAEGMAYEWKDAENRSIESMSTESEEEKSDGEEESDEEKNDVEVIECEDTESPPVPERTSLQKDVKTPGSCDAVIIDILDSSDSSDDSSDDRSDDRSDDGSEDGSDGSSSDVEVVELADSSSDGSETEKQEEQEEEIELRTESEEEALSEEKGVDENNLIRLYVQSCSKEPTASPPTISTPPVSTPPPVSIPPPVRPLRARTHSRVVQSLSAPL